MKQNYNIAKITNNINELKIKIPSYNSILESLFGLLFLFFLSINLLHTFNINYFYEELNFSNILSILIFIYIFLKILYGAFGKEVIQIDPYFLSIKRSIFGLGFKRELEVNSIKNISYSPAESFKLKFKISFYPYSRLRSMQSYCNKINIEYVIKTYSFGYSLSENEAKKILKLIKSKVKINDIQEIQ